MKFFVELRKLILIILIIYLFLKVLFVSDLLTDYVVQVVLYSFVVILASLGLNVIYGFTGQFSLGHAAFYGIGAYASAYFTNTFEIDGSFLFIPAMLAGGCAAAFTGYLIGVPILKLKDDFLAIATLGFGVFIRVIFDNSDRFLEVLGGSRGFVGIPKIANLELIYFTLAFLILITRNIIFSRFGLFWQCIKGDELASGSIGIDTSVLKLTAFVYGCFLAGIGGGLYAHLYTFLHPSNFDILKSIDFLIIVIIGGMGSIVGTILAGVLWVGCIEGLRIILPSHILELRWVIIPVLLIALMMWKPYGLMTRKGRRG